MHQVRSSASRLLGKLRSSDLLHPDGYPPSRYNAIVPFSFLSKWPVDRDTPLRIRTSSTVPVAFRYWHFLLSCSRRVRAGRDSTGRSGASTSATAALKKMMLSGALWPSGTPVECADAREGVGLIASSLSSVAETTFDEASNSPGQPPGKQTYQRLFDPTRRTLTGSLSVKLGCQRAPCRMEA